MTTIHRGRFSATTQDDFVVFLIGMRFNKPWKVRSWLSVARAMPKMQQELRDNPELGCLGATNWGGRITISLQYWRDFESLDAYARDPDQIHLPAWRAFNKAVNDSGDVGIWHETYQVQAGQFEAVYGNMPTFGLAEAFKHVPASKVGQSAAKRIKASEDDITAVDPY
jgi:hypothetical protein